MITIKRYSLADCLEWDSFVEQSKNGTFMLTRGYMDYHSDRFIDFSLLCYCDDKLIALLPGSLHGKEIRSHGGLTYGGLIISRKITTSKVLEVFESIASFLRDNNIESLLYKRVPSLYYSYPSDEDLYALFRMGAKLVRCDISTCIDLSVKISFSERRRRGISIAKKNGLLVKQTNDYYTYVSILSEILSKYHNTKPVHTADELLLLSKKFPKNIKLYGTFKEDRMIAGVVVYETFSVAHCQYIANSEEGRSCGALDILMDFLINDIYAPKHYFDFGISTENGGLFLNEGLITQKQEFGGRGIVYSCYRLLM